MEVLRLLARRISGFALVLFGLSVIIFTIARLIPGDPARIALGPLATEEQVQSLRHEMGLDEPAAVQYLNYISGVLQGDMGESLLTGQPVVSDIAAALPATLELVLCTVFLMTVIAIPLGVLAAYRQNSWVDQCSRLLSLMGVVTPAFLLAILFQLVASVGTFDLPVMERMDADLGFEPSVTGLVLVDSLLAGRGDAFVDGLTHLLLPSLALSAAGIAQVMRITRSSVIEYANRDHVDTLRAAGVPKPLIIFKYLWRLSASAPLTILGLEFASLIGNAFVVEMVFAWPGIASYGVRTILHNDYNAVMGVVLVSGVIFIIANLIIDILVSIVDPRLRLKGAR
ncbi:ABC transporter permease [Parasalinivibrio latis]|uniref:ABC transporter permease n=1 Tax=Parasalinivibrio latis TaxID=2952610 RepID=UPI0030E3FBE3